MKDFKKLQEMDRRARELAGLYAAEKERADALEAELLSLQAYMKGNIPAAVEEYYDAIASTAARGECSRRPPGSRRSGEERRCGTTWTKCPSCGAYHRTDNKSQPCAMCRRAGLTWRTLKAARTRTPKWWR